MAEDVSQAAPAESLVSRRERRTEQARRSSYRFRFGLVYVLLAVVVGAAVGAAAVLATRPGPPEAAAWSAWRPEGSNDRMALQIADHVSKGYRLPSGKQLAIALVGPPEVQEVPVRAIAVNPDTTAGQAEPGDIEVVDAARTVMYILCGLGETCSIAEGEASEARHQLLRREALELSLYAFKYIDEVESVLTFLPPAPKADAATGTTVFLQRSDVADELRRPLNQTLLRAQPPALGEIDAVEQSTIDRLTRPRVFAYEFQQAQDGSAIVVLTPAALAN